MKCAVEGALINYEVEGPDDAPALLLWHGAQCTLRMWDNVIPLICDKYRVIRFDIRGAGMSTPAPGGDNQYCFQQYAKDVNNLLDECGIEQCHSWSMAWGSRAALAYCSLFPERIITASLYDASIGAADVAAQIEGGKKALSLQQAAGIERVPRPEGWNTHQFPESVSKSLGAAAKFNLAAAVSKLTMPLLIATGDHDPNLESSRDLASRAINAKLVIHKNVGHGSILQRPDLTTETFLAFQASLREPSLNEN